MVLIAMAIVGILILLCVIYIWRNPSILRKPSMDGAWTTVDQDSNWIITHGVSHNIHTNYVQFQLYNGKHEVTENYSGYLKNNIAKLDEFHILIFSPEENTFVIRNVQKLSDVKKLSDGRKGVGIVFKKL